MSRPVLLPLLGIALLASFGLMIASAVNRARAQRAPQPATAPAAVAQPVVSAPPLAPAPAALRTARPARPAPPAKVPSFTIERVDRQVQLHARPRGRVIASVGPTTEFGSPQTLTVAARKGGWIGVTSTDLANGKLGWIKAGSPAISAQRTKVSLRVDLSRRRLELLDGSRVLRRITVGIGRPGSPTPAGRFSITDKLAGGSYGPYYGCCILALSGHQVHTPAGWQGGNRLAIHGTNDPSSIGVPSSAGCLHAAAADLRSLMRRVPLGAPVFIRR